MKEKSPQNRYEQLETQLLVIGGGLAGMRAAREASLRGVRVLLLRDGRGASAWVHGLNVPVTKEDSPERFLEDTLKSGKYLNDPALAEILCRGATEVLSEFCFDRGQDGRFSVLKTLGASCPRVVGIKGAAGAVILGELEACRGFEERNHMRALRLLTREGRVSGALCYDTLQKCLAVIHAQAVILASGGFGGIFGFSTNPQDIGGDGIAMAFLAGAKLTDMEFIQFEPTAAVAPPALRGKSVITTMLREGAVMKNGRKEAFLPETGVPDKDELSRYIYREIREGRATPSGGVYYDATGLGRKRLESCYGGYVERYRRAGMDIASQCMEVAPAPHTTLGGVLINGRCETGVEGLFACGEAAGGLHGANRLGGNAGLEVLIFGKLAGQSAAEYLERKRTEEPHAVAEEKMRTALEEVRPALPAQEPWTASAQEPWAASAQEPWALPAQGRHAGSGGRAQAALEAETADCRKRLEVLLEKSLGVMRNGPDMAEASEELAGMQLRIKELLMEAGQCRDAYFHGFRLYNDILTARLALRSALERKGSIGVHARTDSIPEEEGYHILLEKGSTGEILAERRKAGEILAERGKAGEILAERRKAEG